MVTPFDADGSLDLDGAVKLATYLTTEGGNDGLIIAGTTGEVGLPYIVGLAFEGRWYASLGLFCVAMQIASLVAMGGAIYGISRPRQRGRE